MPEQPNPKDENADFSFELDVDFEDELGISDLLKKTTDLPTSEQNETFSDAESRRDTESPSKDYKDIKSEKHNIRKELNQSVVKRLESSNNVQETLRDMVFEAIKREITSDDMGGASSEQTVNGYKLIKSKRRELHEMLDNLDEILTDKSVQDVAAVFSSLLEINNQLCMQKTDGVISVRARIYQFFTSDSPSTPVSKAMRQEISLIFSPEEIQAMRTHLKEVDDDDPLKPFIAMILDQAYDIVQYSEMTGYLMLELASYFLEKLEKEGYGSSPKVHEFYERRKRAEASLDKAINDLRHVESIIKRHLQNRTVLLELPRLLRRLIQVKLGIEDRKIIPTLLHGIKSQLGEYARARSAVAFDFNRVPSYQHSVRLRQSIILNLHRDILKYTGEIFEQEFRTVRDEFERSIEEIEATISEIDPNSPEHEEMLKKKIAIQSKLEEHRRKMDVVRSQQRLVDVQHQLVHEAIDRYKQNESIHQRLEDQLDKRPKNLASNVPTDIQPTKKKVSRMVMVGRRRPS